MRIQILFSLVFIFALSMKLMSQNVDTVNLYFQIDAYEISNENIGILDELIKNQNISDIKIFGYTDFLGTYDHNQQLSKKRAESVKNYLVTKGIANKEIIEVKGLGIHQFSSYENRRNPNDRGIREHRKVEVIFTVNSNDSKDISLNVETEDVREINEEIEPAIDIDLSTISEEDLVEGNKIRLKNINFVGGTPKFLPESDEALKELLAIMKKFPKLKIEIQGHICCQTVEEGDGYDYINDNHTLSFNRARAVFEYLRDNGINGDRMTYVGFASKYKLYPLERDEYEQSQNRRVEIKIIEN
ncbi:MAG TPA: OmpA family protein [Bacteroidales bacterium]|nr:OmpA family protein [Bacteroidales bacterium]